MKFFEGAMQCMTRKNYVDFGNDLAHVMLRLELYLPWQMFALSGCSCLIHFGVSHNAKGHL